MVSINLQNLIHLWESLTVRLRSGGEVIAPLIMRIVMGWEFWESGLEKLRGQNWFADIQSRFPFPFDVIPNQLSWTIATWFEIIGGVLLWVGLGTRFVAFSLLFLTFVATAAVHWPDMISMWGDLLKGYAITDMGHGNYKLPLLFSVMLLPLIFNGAGKLSLDYFIALRVLSNPSAQSINDAYAWSLSCFVLGFPMLVLMPKIGFMMFVIGVLLAVFKFKTKH
jgi:putative oxidoreductase